MKSINDHTVHVLNDLIETCKDGQHGFKTAADDAETPELKQVFSEFSRQRGEFITELQAQVRQLGGDTEKSGSATGSLHRGWINLKSAISSNEAHAVLEECERGEDSAVAAYRGALEDGELEASSRALVRRQYTSVQAAHDQVKQLRDSLAYSSKS